MATVITMPKYGANMEEGTVAAWMVAEGDQVAAGDIIGEIAIEKLSNDLEAPVSGMVLKLIAEEEQTLSCGEPIAIIGEEGEDYSELMGTSETNTPIQEPASDASSGQYTIVEMPRYGANMEEGTIAEWFVEVGDQVEKGDAIGEIAIEKLSNELIAPISGKVLKILAEVEETLACGTPIALIGDENADISGFEVDSQPAVQVETASVSPEKTTKDSSSGGMDGTIVEMPRYGANMEEGTIAEWFVDEGDHVEKGDAIGEIAIEKLSNELLAPASGVIRKILAQVEETLPCGAPIAIIAQESADISALWGQQESGDTSSPLPVKESASEHREVKIQAARDDVTITPKALALAEEEGIDYRVIVGTGRHQTITREDVKNFMKSGAKKPGEALNQSIDQLVPVRITPKGMLFAEEKGIDVRNIPGTGRHGMITRDDIKKAIGEGLALPLEKSVDRTSQKSIMTFGQPQARRRKMSEMQKVISQAMMDSLQNAAQTTITMDMDVSNMVAAYKSKKDLYQQEGVKLSYTAILIKAIAMALIEHEDLRTRIKGKEFVTSDEINIGVAVDIPGGLVVPNIKRTHEKDVRVIANELADLALRAQNNALTMDEMTGGTFSLTNLGMFGIKYFTPVLNPPECAILGVGTLMEQPIIREGGIFVNHIMNFSLTHDHRIVNGAPAARFLNAIQDILSKTEELL